MEHDRAVEAREESGGLVVGLAGVHDDGQAEVGGECELALEDAALTVAGCVVAVEVEPGLADGHGSRVVQELRQLVQPTGLLAARLVRMDAERARHAVLASGNGERRTAGVDSGADRDDPAHAGRARPCEQHRRRFRARVEVRVRVDHAAAGASTRGNSGGAASMSAAALVLPGATFSQPSS